MPVGVPQNFRAVLYPPQNILFYWDLVPGATSYNLYRRPFGTPTWTQVNLTPIPAAKLNYPLMPVDVLPNGVVSTDPFLNQWASLGQENSSDWAAAAVDSFGESALSNIYTFFPKPTQDVYSDRQPLELVQVQRWVPENQRWVNWDGKFSGTISIGEVGIIDASDVRINPATEETSQEILAAIGAAVPGIVVYNTAPAVPAATPTVVVSYAVPAGKKFFLSRAEATGENRAVFWVTVNGNTVGTKRTYWTNYNCDMSFDSIEVPAGQIVRLYCEHNSLVAGNFEGNVQGKLQ